MGLTMLLLFARYNKTLNNAVTPWFTGEWWFDLASSVFLNN